MKQTLVACIGAGLLALAVPSQAAAQATGQINGMVTDTSGGVLPGVTIEVTNRGTGVVRSAVTGPDGLYTVPLLQPFEATDIFLSAGIRGGYAWLFPKGDVANLGLGVEPAAREELKPLLESLHEHLVSDGRVGAQVLGHTGGAIPVGGMLEPAARCGEDRKSVV